MKSFTLPVLHQRQKVPGLLWVREILGDYSTSKEPCKVSQLARRQGWVVLRDVVFLFGPISAVLEQKQTPDSKEICPQLAASPLGEQFWKPCTALVLSFFVMLSCFTLSQGLTV